MKKQIALITGATGFIGFALARELLAQKYLVVAIGRNRKSLEKLSAIGCVCIECDLANPSNNLFQLDYQPNAVFNLAASTRSVDSRDLIGINSLITKNVVDFCLSKNPTTKLIHVSSLAALGPSPNNNELGEDANLNPVSFYGESKAECESYLRKFSQDMPISIARPPIVLGQGDLNGLSMFRSIDGLGCHFTVGFGQQLYSLIHVDDLATCLIKIAQNGRVLQPSGQNGIYHTSCNEVLSFRELGRAIGKSIEKRPIMVPVAPPILRCAGLAGDVLGRLSRKPRYMNSDKTREALAGSWVMSNRKIRFELDFNFPFSIQQRLFQTTDWYRCNGFLKKRANKNVMLSMIARNWNS